MFAGFTIGGGVGSRALPPAMTLPLSPARRWLVRRLLGPIMAYGLTSITGAAHYRYFR